MKHNMIARSIAAGIAVALGCGAALAAAGAPEPWQIGLQDPATDVAERITSFHTGLVYLITFISLFVLALLVYVMVKFNAKANPVPSKTTHNLPLEVIWTAVPALILLGVAYWSLPLLYFQRNIPAADITVKAIGNPGWNWTYHYPDLGMNGDEPKVAFNQNLLPKDQAEAKNLPYLLAADVPMVVPVNKVVKMIITSDPAGIIHAWTIPSFGMKIDAIPGRLNEDWFKANREGVFYGQCSELCGQNHAFMPIEVWVVAEDKYKAWADLMLTSPDEATLQTFLATIKPALPQVASN